MKIEQAKHPGGAIETAEAPNAKERNLPLPPLVSFPNLYEDHKQHDQPAGEQEDQEAHGSHVVSQPGIGTVFHPAPGGERGEREGVETQ